MEHDERELVGFFIEQLEFRVDQFRIPPRELAEMLPQQSLMLKVAAEALSDAQWDDRLALSTGVVIGIGLDLNTTNYHLRWSLEKLVREWRKTLAPGAPLEKLNQWIDELKNAVSSALSANRTTGSLGGMVASRVAREYRIGGPSFTVSCDETSGIQALAIAGEWLRRRELDAAIVGGVEFAGDLRLMLARKKLDARAGRKGKGGRCTEIDGADRAPSASDGAVALVLKRLDDARKDGDRVHAVIRAWDGGWENALWRGDDILPGFVDVHSASPLLTAQPGATSRFLRRYSPPGSPESHALGSITGDLGTAGAATGLAAVAKAALCLEAQIIPGLRACPDWLCQSGAIPGPVLLPEGSQFWLRNRAQGPRRSVVAASNLAGLGQSVLLEESAQIARGHRLDRSTSGQGRGCPPAVVEQLRALLRADSRKSDRASHATDRGRLAFVYPGLGNQYLGMGRALSVFWPDVLRAQDAENEFLRDQFDPRIWWADDAPRSLEDHRDPILGTVALGCLVTDLLCGMGISPDAAIGYSLGETTALVALRAWRGRDELTHRLKSSPLFHTELAGRCDAARRAWGIPAHEPVDWIAGIVPRSALAVRSAIGDKSRVEVLIKNLADETLIGGTRRAVEEVVGLLSCPFFEVSTVSTVHCSIGREVENEYRALHDVQTVAPPGITFFSGVWGRSYQVDRQSAAAAIAAQAAGTIDFPRLIELAYEDGVRIFVEVGPGGSCSRLIGQILRGRPHLACAASPDEGDPLAAIVDVARRLIAHGVPVDLTKSNSPPCWQNGLRLHGPLNCGLPAISTIRVEVRGSRFRVPAPPEPEPAVPQPAGIAMRDAAEAEQSPLWRSVTAAEGAVAAAHRTFLKVAQDSADLFARHAAYELELIEASKRSWASASALEQSRREPVEPLVPPIVLDRRNCLEFAVGSASVLGSEFLAVDSFPMRGSPAR